MTHSERWRLDGKRALVTGGTKGIGYAVATELLRLGATVTIAARTASEVDARVAEWRAEGLDATGIASDLASAEGIAATVSAVGGSLDILINNVGTNIRRPTIDYTADEYRQVMSTNLDSAWEMCRAAYPLLKASGSGNIVNIGSVTGSVAVLTGLPYALGKAALDQLARYLAVEWAGEQIRVNTVNPFFTRTPLTEARLEDPAFVNKILNVTPLKHIAEAEDVAGLVAFLCLPAARHITGQAIAVDGGFLALGLA